MTVTDRVRPRAERPEPVAKCDEPVCPCPGAACAISLWADEERGPEGRTLAALSLLHHATSAVRAHLERTVLAADDLSWTGWEVLAVVDAWGSIEARDVALEVTVAKSTLSGLITTLTRRGLLAREPFPGDARRVLLTLTEPGRVLVARLFPLVSEAEADLVDDLSDSEMAALCNATRKLIRAAQRADGGQATGT